MTSEAAAYFRQLGKTRLVTFVSTGIDIEEPRGNQNMTAFETIQHFEDMGVLDEVLYSANGDVLAITASATEGYAYRCMKDFANDNTSAYYKGASGIDATTSDKVPVVMTFII